MQRRSPRLPEALVAVLLASVVVALTVGVAPTAADAANPMVTRATPSVQAPQKDPGSVTLKTFLKNRTAPACATSADGKKSMCIALSSGPKNATEAAKALAVAMSHPSSAAPNTLAPSELPIPNWCGDHIGDDLFWAVRNEGCRSSYFTLSTLQTTNGVTTLTGAVYMTVLEFLFGDPNLGTTAFQMNISPYSGFGPATLATVTGSAAANSGCTLDSQSFLPQPLLPFNAGFKVGTAYFDTTATAAGAIATCASQYALTFIIPGVGNVTSDPFKEAQFRCDNATAGNSKVGCVIPWYAESLIYRTANTPSLASHVSRAQASGLPGAPGGTPLTRTTDSNRQQLNYTRACNQAPSIPNYSCDEYPLKTSRQGLGLDANWQSHRRTFSGCRMNLPSQTGPVGVSACMIPVADQNSQGGTNTQFYRAYRVLDGDPFYVSVQ